MLYNKTQANFFHNLNDHRNVIKLLMYIERRVSSDETIRKDTQYKHIDYRKHWEEAVI